MKMFSAMLPPNIFIPLWILTAAMLLWVWRSLFPPANNYLKNKTHITSMGKRNRIKHAYWYQWLSRIPILSDYVENIKFGLYTVCQSNEEELRDRTLKILVRSMVLSLCISGVILFFMDKTLYNILMIVFASGYMFHIMVKGAVKNHDVLLEQLPEAINDLKHYFASERTMERAYTETIKGAPYEIGIHLDRILEIIRQPYETGKKKLKQYHEQCPDKYLKILAAYSFLTAEYGDVMKDGESLFNKNMNYLIAEVRNEYRKKRLISSALIGQRLFILSPLFALPILKQYLLSYIKMPEMEEFYQSSYGYLAMLASWCVTLFCYTLYSQVTRTGEYEKKAKAVKKAWEDQLLKFNWIRKVITTLMPKMTSQKYRRIMRNMDRSGNLQKLEWFYLKKLCIALCTFIILFSINQTAKSIQVQRIYSDVAYGLKDKLFTAAINPTTEVQRQQMIENDKKILEVIHRQKLDREKDAKKLKENISQALQEIKDKAGQLEVKNTGKPEEDVDVERIYYKIMALRSIRFFSVDLFIVIFFSFIAYLVPNLQLTLAAYLQNFAMFDEVMSFQTIILLLMHHRRVTVEMILDWLIWFSDIFRVPLTEARNNLNDRETGGIKALNKLKEDVRYKPFQQVIHNLTIAESTLSLKDAFAGLEQDQKFSMELRKDNTQTIVQAKIAIATRITTLSTGFAMLVYLILPLIYASYKLLTGILQTSGL